MFQNMFPLAMVVLSLSASAVQAAPPTSPGLPLLGRYQIIGGEKFGQPIPPEQLGKTWMVITGDSIMVVDESEKNLYSATYQVSPTTDPAVWNVDLVSRHPKSGEKALGLVKLDDNTISLIYSLTANRPTEFKTGERDLMFTMKSKKSP